MKLLSRNGTKIPGVSLEVILVSSQSEGVMEPREKERKRTRRRRRKKRRDDERRSVRKFFSTGWLGNVWSVTRLMWDYLKTAIAFVDTIEDSFDLTSHREKKKREREENPD